MWIQRAAARARQTVARNRPPAALPVAAGQARHHPPHGSQPAPRPHAAGRANPARRSPVPPADLADNRWREASWEDIRHARYRHPYHNANGLLWRHSRPPDRVHEAVPPWNEQTPQRCSTHSTGPPLGARQPGYNPAMGMPANSSLDQRPSNTDSDSGTAGRRLAQHEPRRGKLFHLLWPVRPMW